MKGWREKMIAAASVYHPCKTGVHITGADDAAYQFVTLANAPCDDDAAALLFEKIKAECEARDGEPDDCAVDRYSDGDLVECFAIPRQMVERAVRLFPRGATP